MYIKMFSGTDVVRKQKETPLEISLGAFPDDSNRCQSCNCLHNKQFRHCIGLQKSGIGVIEMLIGAHSFQCNSSNFLHYFQCK